MNMVVIKGIMSLSLIKCTENFDISLHGKFRHFGNLLEGQVYEKSEVFDRIEFKTEKNKSLFPLMFIFNRIVLLVVNRIQETYL